MRSGALPTQPDQFGSSLSISSGGTRYEIPDEATIAADFARLVERADRHRRDGRQIAVVQGLGFVGSAVAAVLANARDWEGRPRYFVLGVDLPTAQGCWKVARLNEGRVPIAASDPNLSRLVHLGVRETANLCATMNEAAYGLADVIVVDVELGATSTDGKIQVEIDGFVRAIRSIGRHMQPDALVVVETTVPVGFTERSIVPVLRAERTARGIRGEPCVAHAYERVMPGPRHVESVRAFWRTFSGIDEVSAARARAFLESFVDTPRFPLTELSDTTSSELAKLLENSYRAANIALIYEWTLLAERLGVNLFEVLDSIRVRAGTHDNIRFPGFGVGGYCLTKDSLLAQWGAEHLFGVDVRLAQTLRAVEVNRWMPLHTLDLICELVDGDLVGKRVAVCGISYLPDVADTRDSPAALLIDRLIAAGADVRAHDPLLNAWPERPAVPLARDLRFCFTWADVVVLAVRHSCYRGISLANWGDRRGRPYIVDSVNVLADEIAAELRTAGCRLLGVGKGHWRKARYQEAGSELL